LLHQLFIEKWKSLPSAFRIIPHSILNKYCSSSHYLFYNTSSCHLWSRGGNMFCESVMKRADMGLKLKKNRMRRKT